MTAHKTHENAYAYAYANAYQQILINDIKWQHMTTHDNKYNPHDNTSPN